MAQWTMNIHASKRATTLSCKQQQMWFQKVNSESFPSIPPTKQPTFALYSMNAIALDNTASKKDSKNMGSWIVVDRYIEVLPVWPMRSRWDFYFGGAEKCTRHRLSTHRSHSTSCSPSLFSYNTDRSLSNNQIEWLNKGIKMYTKSIITIAFILLVIEWQTL